MAALTAAGAANFRAAKCELHLRSLIAKFREWGNSDCESCYLAEMLRPLVDDAESYLTRKECA